MVQGLDALDTGLRMLPVSVTMFLMSFIGARMSQSYTPKQIVKAGLWVLLGAIVLLTGTIEPELEGGIFALSMALLGVGMGLRASQLGNVIQSSVGPTDRSEAGGLQYTAQPLGSAMGTALIGAIVIGARAAAGGNQVANDPRVPTEVSTEISVTLSGSIQFISSDTLADALTETSLGPDEQEAIVESYSDSQLIALRMGLLVAAFVVIGALFVARRLPDISFEEMAAAQNEDEPAST